MRTVSSSLIVLSPPHVFDRNESTHVEEDSMRTYSDSRTPTVRRALVALSVLTLIGGACGSAADDDAQADGVASLRDASNDAEASADDTTGGATADSSSEDSSELEAPEDPEEAFALYDQCLQDHGVDPGEGFVVAGGGDAIAVAPADGAAPAGTNSDGDGPDSQVFVYGEGPNGEQPPEVDQELLDASEACRGHLANATPDFDLTPEQQAAMEDAQLAFQQCMEEHGIEGGGFTISLGDGAALDVDEQPDAQAAPPPAEVDPEQFQAAAEECQSVYDDYPELDDVLPDGGPMGGVSVGQVDSGAGS
jgi:hypothetical protein